MRFFWTVCLIGVIVGSIGCMTKNWSTPLFKSHEDAQTTPKKTDEEFSVFSNGVMERELFGSGIDPQARDIEKRLGYRQK
jgi:hypothetical protein